eukprot:CAMPEP_0183439290 /NCGR_PEP_ID=MMETSP0370-20130417/77917_1 /TAXON_ID=268820 /ORGANISM="Peridinium aciculiferum, Strain PAER-2" /LENGTH=568 /DNA_ID=CAMNT_0025627709 /DNA_START=66 /DNA_END=1769 /DNA_ORIENTATION=+
MAGPPVGLGVLVSVDIKEDRIEDFLKAMRVDALGSRDKSLDPGCLRFDVLRSREVPNRFFFYEAYTGADTHAQHRETAHFKVWGDFKATGAVEKQEVVKLDTASIPGGWAFQADSAPSSRARSAVFVTADIKADRIDDFLKVMEVDVTKSRDKALDPGCLRFDLLRYQEQPNRFMFYEAYLDDDTAAQHKTTDHYKAWADFKASGGVESQTVLKAEAASIPGGWGFQASVAQVGSIEMPLLGFGTYKVGALPASASGATDAPPPPSGPEVCNQVIKDALQTGYRMFDCAQFYMNEAWIGDAWRAAGVPRESLFFSSKVWNDTIYKGPDAVKAQVDKALAELQCGYIDLMLVHWPVPGKHVAAYNALRECKAAGKVKEIGISNYTIEDYEELKAAGAFGNAGADRPTMNQIEVNPLLFRKKTIGFFKQEGVHVQSYRGLMNGPKAWEHPAVKEVSTEIGRTPSQVLGRFLVQQGISHVPKASAASRMAQNAEVFGFELSAAQMEKLSGLTTPEALENFKALYAKCIWRDTPQAGDPLLGERTLAEPAVNLHSQRPPLGTCSAAGFPQEA